MLQNFISQCLPWEATFEEYDHVLSEQPLKIQLKIYQS